MNNFESGTSAKTLALAESFTTFFELFELRCIEYPERPALRFEGQDVSYQDLLSRAEALADQLTAAGVSSGDIVAISIERGIEMIVAVLGCLKSGSVFLPVDPDYPEDRRRYMIEDAAPKAVLLGKRHDFEGSLACRPIVVDLGALGVTKGNVRAGRASTSAANSSTSPAYIVYTSGSTGKPKGAINTHKGLLNLANQQIAAFDVTPESRVLQFASLSFDASISEIVMALGAGSTLVLAQRGDVVPGPSLSRLINEEKITHVTLPPSVLAVLPDPSFPSLKVVIVAGEPCPVDLARRWAANRRFFNAYGVSEAAVCASIREFDPRLESLPIGSAMEGVTLAVRNDDQKQVECGGEGELYIGGVGVGLGYLNRSDLTKQKFVTLDGQRVYRTGDRVRVLLDGSLEFLGRNDNQVKVRGFRIELDEITAAMDACDQVVQSATVLRSPSSGHAQIVGYFIPHSQAIAEIPAVINALRTHLTKMLPAHMVPSLLVPIGSFPLSPSGKIDLANLRTRLIDTYLQRADWQPPQTPTEIALAEFIKDLIQVDTISMGSSFIDMGGDSLQAAQLAWRIAEAFSVHLTEADVIDAPNLSDLALRIETSERQTMPDLVVVDRGEPVDPVPAQEVFALVESFGLDTSPLNCCAAYELHGDVDIETLRDAYRALFARHEGLRLLFPPHGKSYKLVSVPAVDAELEIVDLRNDPQQERTLAQFLAMGERIRFDMAKDLLVRSWLVQLASSKSLLVTIAHHAVFDAWSLIIFLQDLFALVAERQTGRSFLDPLRIQFLDYAVYMRKKLALRDLEAERGYLTKVFERPLVSFDLKEVMPRPKMKSLIGGNVFCKLSKAETSNLAKFAEARKLTPFTVCMTLLKAVFYKHSAQPDITVGGPVSIRYHRELERQIGLYGSAFIIRTKLRDEESVDALLQRLGANLLQSYRTQVYSILEVLQQYEIEAEPSRTAPYDISIASHLIELPLCLPEVQKCIDLKLIPYRYPLTTAFFDFECTFHLFDSEIDLEIRYDATLYKHSQVDQICADFRQLVLSAQEDSSSSVGQVLGKL